MAEDEAQQAALNVQQIANWILSCASTAQALIRARSAWTRGPLLSLFFPTEYQRIRASILELCRVTRPLLRRVRRHTVSPDAIRAAANLDIILQACSRCRAENRARRRSGRSFLCLAQAWLEPPSNRFRFHLNHEGRIVELQ